jgi:2-dehydro-3-deoxygluconokinase
MIELSMAGTDAQVGVAGDTLNTAIYLHRAAPALSVDYVTCLGDDPFSTRIHDFIAAQGVGTSAIHNIAGASPGLYAITTTPEGERSFTYWRRHANSLLTTISACLNTMTPSTSRVFRWQSYHMMCARLL